VPGESLKPDTFEKYEEVQRAWAPESGKSTAAQDPPMAQEPPSAPSQSKEEPWWVAAEGHSGEEDNAAPAPPFEQWDSAQVHDDLAEDASEPPPPALSGAGLPVRTPGTSFKDIEEIGSSAAASESGAMGIRSALASFEGGREMAMNEGVNDDKEDNPPSGGSE
jgi:hypothetical protein